MERTKTTSDPWLKRELATRAFTLARAAEALGGEAEVKSPGIFPMVTLVTIALCRYLRQKKPRSMPPPLLWERVPMCSR
jgi:hypothetical protein